MSKINRELNPRWDNYFLELAAHAATLSKDPSTKVGAVIVTPLRAVRCTGFNGFPRGIADNERLKNRDDKLKLVVHAEENCICDAARNGVSISGCTLYLASANDSPNPWVGPPCSRCIASLIKAGIARIVVRSKGLEVPERWRDDVAISYALIHEAGITFSAVLN